jgi:GNAT superfamily N-acetyltransferase
MGRFCICSPGRRWLHRATVEDPMSRTFVIRRATPANAAVIARHRVQMFADMGELPPHLRDELLSASMRRLEEAIQGEEYVGWLAAPRDLPHEIVAGAGVQWRRVLPHPLRRLEETVIARGRQAIVLNVFTEREWRRQGLADLLMRHLLAWAGEAGVETLVLHASDEGRGIYERLGFTATNEMRYSGDPIAASTIPPRPGLDSPER